MADDSTAEGFLAPTSGLKVKRIPIGDLVEDPSNTRKHNKENIIAIGNSLKRFGQVEPILVRKDNMVVIGGNGRLSVMRDLGWDKVDVVLLDASDDEAKALSIALNRTGDLSEWDYKALQTTLMELQESVDWADEIGWTAEEVSTLISATWDPPEIADLPEPDEDKSQAKIKGVELNRGHRQIFEEAFILAKSQGLAKTESAFIEYLCAGFMEAQQ